MIKRQSDKNKFYKKRAFIALSFYQKFRMLLVTSGKKI